MQQAETISMELEPWLLILILHKFWLVKEIQMITSHLKIKVYSEKCNINTPAVICFSQNLKRYMCKEWILSKC